jgi:hypothetical protein
LDEARHLASDRNQTSVVPLDVSDAHALGRLISNTDIVIRYCVACTTNPSVI